MSLVSTLIGFGLRQALDVEVSSALGVIEGYLRDHSQTLPRALARAHDRAWQTLGVALAGDGFLDQLKLFFASGDDKGIREEVSRFLNGSALAFAGTPAEFRRACLTELKALRKSGRLSGQGLTNAEIARQAAGFARHADQQGLLDGATRAVTQAAAFLLPDHPNLNKLLATPTPGRAPLLVVAFAYFFRREVGENNALANELLFDGLRRLASSQAEALDGLGKALAGLGDDFERVFGVLDEIKDEVGKLRAEGQALLGRVGMGAGVVKPQYSFSIRGDAERRAVKALLERFRQLPVEDQARLPDLLNGLGKLQVGVGNFIDAGLAFDEAARVARDRAIQAEAHFNAYRAALERRCYDEALASLHLAIAADAERFAPVPLRDYDLQRILGAGGFGVTFLCLLKVLKTPVAIKVLNTEDLGSDVNTLLKEATALEELHDPRIIQMKHCGYADAGQSRPYLVMEYFAGQTLEAYVKENGAVPLWEFKALATEVGEALKTAHAKDIFHRDVKPGNILVRRTQEGWDIRLIDFGLALRQAAQEYAQTVHSPCVAGTLDYAAPEQLGQAAGVPIGPPADVFGFARTCCYALFGRPHPLPEDWEKVPPLLRQLLGACLAHAPQSRPATFEVVLQRLSSIRIQRRPWSIKPVELDKPTAPAPAPVAAAPPAPAVAPTPSPPAGLAEPVATVLPAGAQPRLLVLRGRKRNEEYPIHEGQNVLGRADEKPVDIDLEEQEPPDRIWCSRQHACIEFGNNQLVIEDLNSANGTYVNRTRVYSGQKRPLSVNDVVQIGNIQLKVLA